MFFAAILLCEEFQCSEDSVLDDSTVQLGLIPSFEMMICLLSCLKLLLAYFNSMFEVVVVSI